ncbi:MAG: twin-arginine translocase subunit TatC [Polyangiaceae bacterium]
MNDGPATTETAGTSGDGATSKAPEADVRMTIWEHLDELRRRIVRAAIALGVCTILSWNFRVKILAWMVKPYEKAWHDRGLPGAPELQTLSPADVFVGYLQLSLFAGIILSAPVIFYQLWSFISPGLYAKEKRYIVPFVLFSTLLFLGGVAFAYYFGFPFTFGFFFSLLGQVSESGTILTQRPTLEFYLDFATQTILGFGASFELPLFISFLVLAGIVTPQQLVKFTRWAVLLAFILGAIVTPGPEVSAQLVVTAALVALYFLSIGLAYFLKPTKPATTDS